MMSNNHMTPCVSKSRSVVRGGAYLVARAWPRAQNPKDRSSMQVVTRALGCIATANVNAEDLEPADSNMHIIGLVCEDRTAAPT